MLLPWGELTVIEKVVTTLIDAGIDDSIVVVGNYIEDIKLALKNQSVKIVKNPDYATSDMLSSVKIGFRNVMNDSSAALIVLGDQPQIGSWVVKEIVERYDSCADKIIVPSYQKHRGHPWLIDRLFWKEILDIQHPYTLRDFLNQHMNDITYIEVNSPGILDDLDTPEDYLKHRP
jgi:molybdenum cofactor cytidylyltransferase